MPRRIIQASMLGFRKVLSREAYVCVLGFEFKVIATTQTLKSES